MQRIESMESAWKVPGAWTLAMLVGAGRWLSNDGLYHMHRVVRRF